MRGKTASLLFGPRGVEPAAPDGKNRGVQGFVVWKFRYACPVRIPCRFRGGHVPSWRTDGSWKNASGLTSCIFHLGFASRDHAAMRMQVPSPCRYGKPLSDPRHAPANPQPPDSTVPWPRCRTSPRATRARVRRRTSRKSRYVGVPRTKPSGRHGQALEEKLLGARRAVGEETLRAPRARVLRRSRTLWLSGGRKWCRKPVLAPALRAPWWHALLSGSTAQWRCQDRGFLDHAHRNVSCYLLAGQESRRVLG